MADVLFQIKRSFLSMMIPCIGDSLKIWSSLPHVAQPRPLKRKDEERSQKSTESSSDKSRRVGAAAISGQPGSQGPAQGGEPTSSQDEAEGGGAALVQGAEHHQLGGEVGALGEAEPESEDQLTDQARPDLAHDGHQPVEYDHCCCEKDDLEQRT